MLLETSCITEAIFVPNLSLSCIVHAPVFSQSGDLDSEILPSRTKT